MFTRRRARAPAQVRTFLLEKSRVTNASLEGERSYHIFYQILAGVTGAGLDLGCLASKQPSDFMYTSLSGTAFIEAIDDVTDFRAMDAALNSCGLEAEKIELYEIFSAVRPAIA